MEAAITGMLQPVEMQVVDAHAEVLQVFPIRGMGKIAGSRVLDGAIQRGAQVHVYRGGELIADGEIRNLRRFQDDVQSVDAGQECGIALTTFDDFEAGDQLEFYHVETQSRISSGGEIHAAPR